MRTISAPTKYVITCPACKTVIEVNPMEVMFVLNVLIHVRPEFQDTMPHDPNSNLLCPTCLQMLSRYDLEEVFDNPNAVQNPQKGAKNWQVNVEVENRGKKCSNCGKPVGDKVKKCPNCGNVLS